MPTKILEIMKKIMFLGLLAFSFTLMSVNSYDSLVKGKKPLLVEAECPDGYTFEYFEHESFTQADYDEMYNAVCGEDHGQ